MSVLMVVDTGASQLGASVPPAMDSVLSMRLFLIVIGVPILSLSVLMEQQRGTEQSLRESEARFRNIADTAPVMIWIAGPDKLATFFNKGLAGVHGTGDAGIGLWLGIGAGFRSTR